MMTAEENDHAVAREVLVALAILGLAVLGWSATRLLG